ncbi:MAG: hypothetical protein JXA10_04770 [Anaerolineae bacterium]|nr:hypothetical protein [Anaerolineae bacterium]
MPKVITIIAAVVAVIVVGVAGYMLLQPPGDLLTHAGFDDAQISPNADGKSDITTIRYSLARNATVSIYLDGTSGERFYFRENEARVAGDYGVQFSGVVDGFLLPGEEIPGTLERRLMPNDTYTWVIEAVRDDETQRATGTLAIVDADSALPIISSFDIHPPLFTPNQDGIRDRVSINVYLQKEANLAVYLQGEDGVLRYLSEREEGRAPGDMGNHEFDYDGGVDDSMEPPPDGDYMVYAIAQDDEGQRIVRQGTLTLADGGLPQAEISSQATGATVFFDIMPYNEKYYNDRDTEGEKIAKPEGVASTVETLTMVQGDMLVFKLTVYNYGSTPIRTAGPFPGTVYDYDQTAASLEAYEQSGAWRIGINCHTSYSDFPWRWAIGSLDELTTVYDEEDDETYYYLEPGQRAETWGAIRMSEIRKARNPQECWAGLIHEDVGIPEYQSRVGAREVELVPPPDTPAEANTDE